MSGPISMHLHLPLRFTFIAWRLCESRKRGHSTFPEGADILLLRSVERRPATLLSKAALRLGPNGASGTHPTCCRFAAETPTLPRYPRRPREGAGRYPAGRHADRPLPRRPVLPLGLTGASGTHTTRCWFADETPTLPDFAQRRQSPPSAENLDPLAP